MMIKNTFMGGVGISERQHRAIDEVNDEVKHSIPNALKRRCKWAFPKNPKPNTVYVPRAYVIGKRKKGFAKGRPIVTATNMYTKKLHTAVGRVISDLTMQILGSKCFNKGTT